MCGRQPLRWSPVTPAPHSCPCVLMSLPLSMAGPSDLLPQVWQKWWDVTFKVRLQQSFGFHQSLLGGPVICSEGSHLPLCELPCGAHVGQQPLKTRCLPAAVCVSLVCKQTLPHQPSSSLEMAGALSDTLLPFERSWVRCTQLSHTQIPDPRELWDNTCSLF